VTDLAPDRQRRWAPAWLAEVSGYSAKFASRDLAVDEVEPTALPGLQLWLDASKLDGLADTDPVSSWTDMSGNAKHAVQALGARQPLYRTGILNGRPGILYDGSNDCLQTPEITLGHFTFFCVFKLTGSAGIVYEGASAAAVGHYLYGTTGNTIRAWSAAGTSGKDLSVGWAVDNVARLTSHVSAGTHASHVLYINGAAQTLSDSVTGDPGAATQADGLNVGARDDGASLASAGYIFELVVYDRALTDVERVQVENYLGRKYGIAVSVETPAPAFYHGRLLGDPAVEVPFFDSFSGTTGQARVAVRIANADQAHDVLHTTDRRGQTLTLTRYDEESGTAVEEFSGRVSTTRMGEGWVELEAAAPDLAPLETLVPKGTVAAATFANAKDLGATIPVVFGNVERHWCPYVNDDRTNDQYDYLVGRGALTVDQMYRLAGDGTLHKIETSEYTVETTRYAGLTTVRFPRRQVDWQNALFRLYADVTGLSAERNFARAVKTLLSDSTYGLGQSVNTASFTTAEAQIDPTTGTETIDLYCDGALSEPRAAGDVLRELMMVRGLRLSMNADGEWTVAVDAQQADVRMAVRDGTGAGERNLLAVVTPRERPPLEQGVKDLLLDYSWDALSGYRLRATRTVAATYGRDLLLQSRFIRQPVTADRVAHYLKQRELYGNEVLDVQVTQEARQAAPGERVTLTYAPLGYSSAPMEVRQVSKQLERISARLAPWSTEFYTYTCGALPTDPGFPTAESTEMPAPLIAPAPATTPPAFGVVTAPTALTAVQGGGKVVEVNVTYAEPVDWASIVLYRACGSTSTGSAVEHRRAKAKTFHDEDVEYLTCYAYWPAARSLSCAESSFGPGEGVRVIRIVTEDVAEQQISRAAITNSVVACYFCSTVEFEIQAVSNFVQLQRDTDVIRSWLVARLQLDGPNDGSARTAYYRLLRNSTTTNSPSCGEVVYSQSLSLAGAKSPNVTAVTVFRSFRLEEPCSTGFVSYHLLGRLSDTAGGAGYKVTSWRFLADAKSA